MARKSEVSEQSLESILWNCRNAIRGTVGGNEKNRDAVMGLVFLKFAGDKFEKRREVIKQKYGDIPAFLEKASFYLSENVFYLTETSRWPYIIKNASSDGIAVLLDKTMADIEDKNPSLKGALPQNFYATLGARSASIKGLIDEINKIDEKRFHDKDLIGRVYEYFLQVFAIDAGQGAEKGEFYTPASIVRLIAELIEPYSGRVYDPCCGSGGMFVQSVKFVERHNGNRLKISVIGQESNPDTWRLAKMNLAIRGISYDLGDRATSSFIDDRHKDNKVDFIMANPPFNLKNWRGKNELADDYRWKGYGIPPASNANYAWILHMLSKLDTTCGIAGFLLANGALNSENDDEYKIRKQLIENDKIEAIIVLPREMFYSTDISVTLWILNNNKKARELNGRKLRDHSGQVLFIDLRQWSTNIYEKKYVMLDDEQIAAVKKIYTDWQTGIGYSDVPELCKSATLVDIRKQKYSLAPSKYIKFIDRDLHIGYTEEMSPVQCEIPKIVITEKLSQSLLESMIVNQRAYENGLDELKLMCDIYIERLRRELPQTAIGAYIEQSDERNTLALGEDSVRGLSTSKEIIMTKADLGGVELSSYKVLRPKYIAYVPDTSRRGNKISLGLNNTDEVFLVSSISTVFRTNMEKLLPAYLLMFFCRSEFDRYTRFHSWGSARETFSWADMCEVKIPMPDINMQRLIVNMYKIYLTRKNINEKLKNLIKDIAQH